MRNTPGMISGQSPVAAKETSSCAKSPARESVPASRPAQMREPPRTCVVVMKRLMAGILFLFVALMEVGHQIVLIVELGTKAAGTKVSESPVGQAVDCCRGYTEQ